MAPVGRGVRVGQRVNHRMGRKKVVKTVVFI